MALAGSVTVNPDGSRAGSGEALRLYDLLVALYAAAGTPSRRELANLCNVFATLADAPQWEPTPIQTSNYTAKPGELVLCDPTVAAFTVTLPEATLGNLGHGVWVKNVTTSTNVITVAAPSLIDGAASQAISGAFASQQFFSAGSLWRRVGVFNSL